MPTIRTHFCEKVVSEKNQTDTKNYIMVKQTQTNAEKHVCVHKTLYGLNFVGIKRTATQMEKAGKA